VVVVMTIRTIGTHNLHDHAGEPTFFADVVFFTECIGPKVREACPAGFQVMVCPQQPDLAIAFREDLFTPTRSTYRRAHPGEAGFTPNRGTFVVFGRGLDLALIVEHRIEKSFNPHASRLAERQQLWAKHTRLTAGIIRRQHRRGGKVLAGGDLNTWTGHTGYSGLLDETGVSLDRLGASPGIGLAAPCYLTSKGSDHKRLRAELLHGGGR
jgi:hypothetical protein